MNTPRNILLAVLLLIAGFALGLFFPYGDASVKNQALHQTLEAARGHAPWKGPRPKNIVFMVGDGMGLTQIYAGMTANKGRLNLEAFKHIGFSKTYSADDYITDSAAGATAFSIGKKTFNGAIGVDADSLPQPTILEIAERHGLATGMVATSQITHATPASFVAHQPSRQLYQAIALDFLKTDVDLFVGGGKRDFMQREDGQDLTEALRAKGYQVCFSLEEVLKQPDTGKFAGLLADVGMPSMLEGRGNMLEQASVKALNALDARGKGFFLLVEGSQIDWGGHANQTGYVVSEMLDFDRTIGKVLEWAMADGQTLVVVTADHETGGMSLVEGDLAEGELEAHFSTTHHTAVMVPVFAYGPGAELFMGIYENISIYDKFMALYGFQE